MEYLDKIEYSNLEEYKKEIDFWYRRYNISREKVELFYDFLLALYENIDETYLGDDIDYEFEDIEKHFKWCWNKVIQDFEKERIFFKGDGALYEYMFGFFHGGYYTKRRDGGELIILKIFDILFNENIVKIQSEIETFTDFYQLFNLALKK